MVSSLYLRAQESQHLYSSVQPGCGVRVPARAQWSGQSKRTEPFPGRMVPGNMAPRSRRWPVVITMLQEPSSLESTQSTSEYPPTSKPVRACHLRCRGNVAPTRHSPPDDAYLSAVYASPSGVREAEWGSEQ